MDERDQREKDQKVLAAVIFGVMGLLFVWVAANPEPYCADCEPQPCTMSRGYPGETC